jgi:hypothetical protein
VISLIVLYLSQIRGPNITARLLDAPITWSTSYWQRPQSTAFSATPADADYGQFTGTISVLLSNDGPKGGAVWALQVDCPQSAYPLHPLTVSRLPTTVTIPGYSTDSLEVTVSLAWAMTSVADVLQLLKDPVATFAIRLIYRRRAWCHDTTRSSVLIALWRDVWRSLNTGASGLAEIAIRPDVDRGLQELKGKFHLGEADIAALRDSLWWGLANRAESFDYILDDSRTAPHLLLRRGYQWQVSGPQNAKMLARVAEDHRSLVDRMRRLAQEREQVLEIAPGRSA